MHVRIWKMNKWKMTTCVPVVLITSNIFHLGSDTYLKIKFHMKFCCMANLCYWHILWKVRRIAPNYINFIDHFFLCHCLIATSLCPLMFVCWLVGWSLCHNCLKRAVSCTSMLLAAPTAYLQPIKDSYADDYTTTKRKIECRLVTYVSQR